MPNDRLNNGGVHPLVKKLHSVRAALCPGIRTAVMLSKRVTNTNKYNLGSFDTIQQAEEMLMLLAIRTQKGNMEWIDNVHPNKLDLLCLASLV